MDNIDTMVGSVLSHLSSAANSSVIAGDPIELGEVTLVVLSTLSVGMGAAGGEGSNPGKTAPEGGGGEGAGGGVKVRPAAAIVFTPEGVEVLPIPSQPDVFDKMVERMPKVVDMVEQAKSRLEG